MGTKPTPENDRPPILGSWKNLYMLLIGALLLQVLLYYLITVSFG